MPSSSSEPEPMTSAAPPSMITRLVEYWHWKEREPIGVLFSGGIDSGSVFLVLYHLLLTRGQSPARLKAFTLAIDGAAEDARQAREFLDQLDLGLFLEVIDVPAADIDYRAAIRVIEDYKPLDVQSATMALALCQGIRQRYPDWKLLVDGDGGDENLKDYPIEENPEEQAKLQAVIAGLKASR